MKHLNFQEEYSSKLPALRLLINAGYQYLSPEEAMELRYHRTGNVLLEPILKEQLARINEIQVSSTQTEKFTQSNIDEAVLRLKEINTGEGYINATKGVYERLCYGVTLEQTIGGNRREYTLQYIDWKNPENNVFHITEEYRVARTDGRGDMIPDIILFVNGIPLVIIENKREDMKDPLAQAISQHLRNEAAHHIRNLYFYAQLLIVCAVGSARYGTNSTPAQFWSTWREKEIEEKELLRVKNQVLPTQTRTKIIQARHSSPYFSGNVAAHIHKLLTEEYLPTVQDELLYAIAQPKRLLDLIQNFIFYDNGIKKIARYQQYFSVKRAMKQITEMQAGQRRGGVVWHTQGSGKSLTMAWLAQAIAKDQRIKNPKIILVTDRTDLDKQITGTFENVEMEVKNAKTGNDLIEILESNTDAVITTIINKFDTAVKRIKQPLTDNNIFVLVDEGHRTQHGTFNINMQKALPNACFIAFTGTPLFKQDKSTVHRFGSMIDTYTVRQAVEDGAVLPLIYEGRYPDQVVNKKAIDAYFNKVAERLNEDEKVDLKRKFSSRRHIAQADQNIYAIALDISEHYVANFQGIRLKGQLVCQNKLTAVKYYEYIREFGKVSCELIISPPDDREGNETAYGKVSDKVLRFWGKMMDQHGNSKTYEDNLIKQFKYNAHPELIIVVDKLLTGFDAPLNTVLYLTRQLKEHTLLQAIARVNRLHKDKDYGYIVDYAGVMGDLDEAMSIYYDFEDFDQEDLVGTLTTIKEEIKKLDPTHQELLNIFKTVSNKEDAEAYQRLLRAENIRDKFYKQLAKYARILKLALSSMDFHKETPEKKIQRYKDDLKFFMNLRTAVAKRYSDKIDYKEYEGQIQKLIDQHVTTESVERLTELVEIFDEEAFRKEVEKTVGEAAQADTIASRTKKHINEKMDEDPIFYKRFSQLIQQTIDDFYSNRITELEYLRKIKEQRDQVLSKTDSSIPLEIRNNSIASAYYGHLSTFYDKKNIDIKKYEEILVKAALKIDEIITDRMVVNWEHNLDIQKQMVLHIGDYLYDEISKKIEIDVGLDAIDEIAEAIVSVAKNRV